MLTQHLYLNFQFLRHVFSWTLEHQWYFCSGPSSAGLLCVLHLRACDCDKQFRLGMLL